MVAKAPIKKAVVKKAVVKKAVVKKAVVKNAVVKKAVVKKAVVKNAVVKNAVVKKAVVKKAVVKNAVVKKAVVKEAVVKGAVVKEAKNEGAEHWSEGLKSRFKFCSMPEWALTQGSLISAWKNCDRTDWMMHVLHGLVMERTQKGYVLSEARRQALRNKLVKMATKFGEKWRSRMSTGDKPSGIRSKHLSAANGRTPWTHEERMEMTDFIRSYFPTPAFK